MLAEIHVDPALAEDAVVRRLTREIPELRVVAAERRALTVDTSVTVDHGAFTDEAWDPFAFDAPIVRALIGRARAIVLEGAWTALEVVAIATRYQRLVQMPPLEPTFARALELHREMHDLDKALVRADHEHALDAWRWLRRFAPGAALDVQLAVLLHDVERLVSEADVRVEQHAPDYQAFKDEHARSGAPIARDLVRRAGGGSALAASVASLVARHERPSAEAPLAWINDADALSFFSLNSAGYARYFGPAATRKKIRYTLRRLDARRRGRLVAIRFTAEVQALLAEVLPEEPSAVASASAAPSIASSWARGPVP